MLCQYCRICSCNIRRRRTAPWPGHPNEAVESGAHAWRIRLVAAAQLDAVLQVEAGTPFARWQAAGRLSFPDDEAGADMYRDASHMLRQVLP